ncbi:glycosyltransferase [Oceanobacter antarcticus]|uniref:Glycosyltransferase n=1 Tax=Oceanobacter antarcticus TaxID=3133425 RepID=A0ABW8NEI0_9GAMM
MIFVTVGTQLPFDRLLDWVSEALAALGIDEECIAQVGETDKNWAGIHKISSVSTSEFSELIERARLVIAHAGMGTIIQCASIGKPLIIVPRLSRFGEHRNDHQVDTAEKFSSSLIQVISDREQLIKCVNNMLQDEVVSGKNAFTKSSALGCFLSDYIDGCDENSRQPNE